MYIKETTRTNNMFLCQGGGKANAKKCAPGGPKPNNFIYKFEIPGGAN